RTPLKVDIIRDRQALAREVEWRWIENVYRLQLINTTEGELDVAIAAESAGLPGLSVEYERGAGHLAPTSNRLLPLRLRVPLEQAASGT
ncbi:FixG Ig-like domain-containing protein, partial [Acinetobacter baumannii]